MNYFRLRAFIVVFAHDNSQNIQNTLIEIVPKMILTLKHLQNYQLHQYALVCKIQGKLTEYSHDYSHSSRANTSPLRQNNILHDIILRKLKI